MNRFLQAFTVRQCVLIIVVSLLLASAAHSQPLFGDDFSSGPMSTKWQAGLPNRVSGSLDTIGHNVYLGTLNPAYLSVDGSSVGRFTTVLNPDERVGWQSKEVFQMNAFRLEMRFNTLTQSAAASIDGFIEMWIIDASDLYRYDLIGPFGSSWSTNRLFGTRSSIDPSQRGIGAPYKDHTWYRMVLQAHEGQNITASFLNDDGSRLVPDFVFGHTAAAFPNGFRIGISQEMGAPPEASPVDVAVDYVRLGAGSKPVVSLHRLSDITQVANPDGAVDSSLEPRASFDVLDALPAVTKGVVADDVTPLIIKVELAPSGNFDPVDLTFTPLNSSIAYGSGDNDVQFPLETTLKVFHPGDGGGQGRWEIGHMVPIDPEKRVGYALLPGIKTENVEFGDGENEVLLGITGKLGGAEGTAEMRIAKPPIVFVHGTGSSEKVWGAETAGAFLRTFQDKGRRPLTVNYGSVDAIVDGEEIHGSIEPIFVLAPKLEVELFSKIASEYSLSEWAMTHYDVVGHSQGGVLLRMLCKSYPANSSDPTPFRSVESFRNNLNFNRGRFRRIITIGAPHNGLILIPYLIELNERERNWYRPVRNGLLDILLKRRVLDRKWDPFGSQVKWLNSPGFTIDQAAPFHLMATLINGGRPPTPGEPNVRAYKSVGLVTLIGRLVLRNGSDGVAEPESALAGSFGHGLPGQLWRTANAPHAAAGWKGDNLLSLFGAPDESVQTSNVVFAADILALLDGKKWLDGEDSPSFDSFARPNLRSEDPEQMLVLAAVPDVAETDPPRESPDRGTVPHEYQLETPFEDIVPESLEWELEVFGPQIEGMDSPTIEVDTDDPRIVTVHVDDSIMGEVVLSGTYTSASGTLVLIRPLVVQSRPISMVQTGISLGAERLTLWTGSTLPLRVLRTYGDGNSCEVYFPPGSSLGITSSNSAAVRVETDGSLSALRSGSALITAALDGFTTTLAVTVDGTVPAPTVGEDEVEVDTEPVIIMVLENDWAYGGGPLTITSATPPAHGNAVINGINITYTPDASFRNSRDDAFQYSVQDGVGTSAQGQVRIVNANPTIGLPSSPIVVEAVGPGGAIVEFSVSAYSPVDGEIVPLVNPPSGSTFPVGTTMVSCSVLDSRGRSNTVSFPVIVTDTTPPLITISGQNPVSVPRGVTYVDGGASAVDLVSGSVTVSISGTVNTSVIGTYSVLYSAADAAGNQATATRVVSVVSRSGEVDAAYNPLVVGGVNSLAVQPDGKAVIGGSFTTVGGQPRNRIARLNPDGTVEGTGTFNPGIGANNGVSSLAVQTDGKILLAGDFTSVGGQSRNKIARLNANGTVDAFDPGPGIGGGVVWTLAVQADGKILIGGDFTTVGGQSRNRIARLNPDGTVEGTETFNPGVGVDNAVSKIAVQADGKILLWGEFSTVGGQARNRIARLNANGSVDTFNPTISGGNVLCLAEQPDGKILLAGNFTTVAGQPRFLIARVDANGAVETTDTFNPGDGPSSNVSSMALQADGKILIGGRFEYVDNQPRRGIARLHQNGSLESTDTFNIGSGAGGVLGLQADGMILLGFARLFNDPATQSITVPTRAKVQWARGGAAPEVGSVTFELSTDSGVNWSLLGPGGRITGGWERNGINLPTSGSIRARGRSSVGLVEQVYAYTVSPEIVLEQPAGVELSDGSAMISFGEFLPGVVAPLSFTVRNIGNADLTGILASIDGPDVADFAVTIAPAAQITPGGSTGLTVRFSPATTGAKSAILHLASNDSDENPFDITLTGTALTQLEAWRRQFFGMTADSGSAANTFDFDKDGLVNVVEYAFGLDPTLGSSMQLPEAQLVGNEWIISFPSPTGVNGVTRSVEWSANLTGGTWTAVPDTGTPPQHTFKLPITGLNRVFLRMVVSVP